MLQTERNNSFKASKKCGIERRAPKDRLYKHGNGRITANNELYLFILMNKIITLNNTFNEKIKVATRNKRNKKYSNVTPTNEERLQDK